MISTGPLISKPSSPITNPLGIDSNAPISMGMNRHVQVPSFLDFFSSLARSRYWPLFSPSFNLTLCYLFFDFHKVWSSGRDLVIRLYIKIYLSIYLFYFTH